jgi:hypothetical protein
MPRTIKEMRAANIAKKLGKVKLASKPKKAEKPERDDGNGSTDS